jgi:hypothetical protein
VHVFESVFEMCESNSRSPAIECTHLLPSAQHQQKKRVFSTIADGPPSKRFRNRGSSKCMYLSRFSRCVNPIADHRGEHEVSRKTIARGMPGNPGVTVVTTLVCFLLCTRGCGRIRRPAFPAPSEFQGEKVDAQLGRIAPRDSGPVSQFGASRIPGCKSVALSPRSVAQQTGILTDDSLFCDNSDVHGRATVCPANLSGDRT